MVIAAATATTEEVLDWNWLFMDHGLSPAVRLTYVFIVSRISRKDGSLAMSLEALGTALRFSYATVWKYIHELETLGYLRIETHSGHHVYFPLHQRIKGP